MVGDLKRVLSNVKTRGTWGEVQLSMLLEQVLTPDQYEANVACKAGRAERVEYAIRLPGQEDGKGAPVWLPIDAKFPLEDYQRMLEAQGQGDLAGVEQALRGLEARVKLAARDIQGKYLNPPHTTDFGTVLPTEGLYAEVLRRRAWPRRCNETTGSSLPGLRPCLRCSTAYRWFSHAGYREAVQRGVAAAGCGQTQFGQFGGLLEKVGKKLDQASSTIEDAARKSRVIERKLKDVEEIPADGEEDLFAWVDGELEEAAWEDADEADGGGGAI